MAVAAGVCAVVVGGTGLAFAARDDKRDDLAGTPASSSSTTARAAGTLLVNTTSVAEIDAPLPTNVGDPYPGATTWTIVEGSGSGDLLGITGSGTIVSKLAETGVHYDYAGTVVCPGG